MKNRKTCKSINNTKKKKTKIELIIDILYENNACDSVDGYFVMKCVLTVVPHDVLSDYTDTHTIFSVVSVSIGAHYIALGIASTSSAS